MSTPEPTPAAPLKKITRKVVERYTRQLENYVRLECGHSLITCLALIALIGCLTALLLHRNDQRTAEAERNARCAQLALNPRGAMGADLQCLGWLPSQSGMRIPPRG